MAVMATLALPGDVGGFTVDDLEAFPDDGRRYELVDGVLLVSPAPRFRHQVAAFELAKVLSAACPPELYVVTAPVDVRQGRRTSLQPDVMVFRRDSIDLDRAPLDPPLLAVEVLSPSSRDIDQGLKRLTYARLGVPSYWIVDPGEPSLLAHVLDTAGGYAEIARGPALQPVALDRPFPVVVVPQALLADLDRRQTSEP
jgi:Uma2 family endonuclease